MDGQTLLELQANILFWIIIALFAWQGYQRGLVAELVKMAFIIVGFLVGQPDMWGSMFVKAVNGFWFAFQFLIHGGLEAIATGNFNTDTLNAIFKEISELPPLIQSPEMGMFLAMLFLIGVGYLVSKLVKPKWPGMGLVAGAINGILLSYIFLPKLPNELPFKFEDLSPAGILKQLAAFAAYLVELAIDLTSRFLAFLFDIFGQWTIPILILVVLVIVLWSMKPAKKQGGAAGNGGQKGGG